MTQLRPEPSWVFRRRMIWTVIGLCWLLIFYVAWRTLGTEGPASERDLAIAATLVLGSFATMGTTLSTYIGSAAWQDTKLRTTRQEDDDDV
jgi:hypothetical protein